MDRQRSTASVRQAVLLFVQEYRRERKQFGFGHRMDQSIHRAMLQRTYALLQELQGVDIIVVRGGDVPDLPGAQYLSQRGDGFNDRFLAALSDSFALGYQRIVAIGGDIPTLQHEDLRQAFEHQGVVVGPTHDGGFYLAAIEKEDVPFFGDLPWRRPSLLRVLQQRLVAGRRSCRCLTRRGDIDQVADARRYASLLVRLVKQWLGVDREIPQFFVRVGTQLMSGILAPRFISLPPPCPGFGATQ